MQRTWFGTNQKRCGLQAQSDWPILGGIFIPNFDSALTDGPIGLIHYGYHVDFEIVMQISHVLC